MKTVKEGLTFKIDVDYVGEFHEGLALVMKRSPEQDRVGFVDETGELKIPMQYFSRVRVNGRERFSHFPFFNEGLAPVMDQTGRFGYLDPEGRTVIPFQYEDARMFSSGLAAVRQEGKYGYIDRSGALKIPFTFDKAGEFGLALVERNGQRLVLNGKGDAWRIDESAGEIDESDDE